MSRPQYKTSCGISSLVSCWNYLFSTLGHGRYVLHASQEGKIVLLLQVVKRGKCHSKIVVHEVMNAFVNLKTLHQRSCTGYT